MRVTWLRMSKFDRCVLPIQQQPVNHAKQPDFNHFSPLESFAVIFVFTNTYSNVMSKRRYVRVEKNLVGLHIMHVFTRYVHRWLTCHIKGSMKHKIIKTAYSMTQLCAREMLNYESCEHRAKSPLHTTTIWTWYKVSHNCVSLTPKQPHKHISTNVAASNKQYELKNLLRCRITVPRGVQMR